MTEKKQACKLFEFCNCKTAMCRAYPPDESCYYYRYFKKIIERTEKSKNKKKEAN